MPGLYVAGYNTHIKCHYCGYDNYVGKGRIGDAIAFVCTTCGGYALFDQGKGAHLK